MTNDPIRFEWRGQLFELESGEASQVLRTLTLQIRKQIWASPKARFESWQSRWQWYANTSGTMRWLFEAAGGADLPRENQMASISRTCRQLDRLLAPRTLDRFMNGFPSWYRMSGRFCNDMVVYTNRFEAGGERTVRVLEFTRDRSFEALSVLATIASGGTAGVAGRAIAVAARQTGAQILMRQAATNFLTRGISDCAGNLGNALAGTPVSGRVVARQIASNALSVVPDMMLGELVGRFLRPLTGSLKGMAEQAIRRGNFGTGVTLEVVSGRLESIILDTLQRMFTQNPRDIRQMLEEAMKESNDNAAGRRGASVLMENRNFRNALQANLAA